MVQLEVEGGAPRSSIRALLRIDTAPHDLATTWLWSHGVVLDIRFDTRTLDPLGYFVWDDGTPCNYDPFQRHITKQILGAHTSSK